MKPAVKELKANIDSIIEDGDYSDPSIYNAFERNATLLLDRLPRLRLAMEEISEVSSPLER